MYRIAESLYHTPETNINTVCYYTGVKNKVPSMKVKC